MELTIKDPIGKEEIERQIFLIWLIIVLEF